MCASYDLGYVLSDIYDDAVKFCSRLAMKFADDDDDDDGRTASTVRRDTSKQY